MPLNEEPTLVSTFRIGVTLMGVNSQDVQEVIQLSTLTKVHHAKDYLAGIINLRGQIVTVVDLKRRLGIETQEENPARVIFIVSSQDENIGLLVDEAADVIPADLNDLAPMPANMSITQQKFLKGICQGETHPIAILDLNAVLSVEEDETTSPGSR